MIVQLYPRHATTSGTPRCRQPPSWRFSARGRRIRFERQAHGKCRSLSRRAVDGNRAAVGAHERVDDAETEPGTGGRGAAPSRVAAPEALEDAGLILDGDPGALVGDRHLGPTAIPL